MKMSATILLFLTSATAMAGRYQVISQHPHDVEHLEKYVKTVSKNGRLWIVDGSNVPAKVLKHLRPLSGKEKSFSYSTHQKFAPNPMIQATTQKLSESLIRDYVSKLAGYKTRLVGTEDNQKATDDVEKNLSELGYTTKKICYTTNACSVIADKKGSAKSEKVLLVMAHIDSVGKDFAGADDNASGTAVLMDMARVLSSYQNQKSVRFFVTNGEESGLLGAEHYVKSLRSSGGIKQIELAINMDMVGYNSNGVVELETNPEYESVAKWFAQLASTYTTLKNKITIGAWGSDHVPFLKAGVPTLLTIELWDTKTPCYHKACDKPEGLNYAYATEIGKLNVAAIMAKDIE
jgi:hypothetical protein